MTLDPMGLAESPERLLEKLWLDTREPPPDKVAVLRKEWTAKDGSRKTMSADYMGHADVTDELLKHDPRWTWEPFALDAAGLPQVDRDSNGWPRGMWIRLTVHGHTRPGYGTVPPGKDDAIKELIGDALRNAAMRFGIGLKLWSKAEWQELEQEGPGAAAPETVPAAPRTAAPPPPPTTTPGDLAPHALRVRVSKLEGPSAKAWNEYRKTQRLPGNLEGLTPGQLEAIDALLVSLAV